MNPYASWAIVLALIGLFTWHCSGRPNLLARFIASDLKPGNDEKGSSSKARKKPKTKKDTSSDDNRDAGRNVQEETLRQTLDVPMSRKRKIAAQPVTESNLISKGVVQIPNKGEAENDESTKAFADRMSRVQAGTPLKSPEKAALSKKEQRAQNVAGGANQPASPIVSTGPSSSTGAEADDDMSPITSPPLDASKVEATKSGDVSDMLEIGPGGPSILRLTGDVSLGSGKKVIEAPFQAAETKKQRQARTKRERHKEEIAEAEKQRKALMEQQLKTARQADGTSKQLKTNAFNVKPNAWSQTLDQKSPNGGLTGNVAKTAPLLDTFDSDQRLIEVRANQVSTGEEAEKASIGASKLGNGKADKTGHASSNQDVTKDSQHSQKGVAPESVTGADNPPTQDPFLSNKPVKLEAKKEDRDPSAFDTEGKTSWADDLPSEEEQMRRLRDTEEDSWNVVTSRKDKKKAPKSRGPTDSSFSSDISATHANLTNGHNQQKATAPQAPKANQGNGFASLAIPSSGDGFQDSEWEA